MKYNLEENKKKQKANNITTPYILKALNLKIYKS